MPGTTDLLNSPESDPILVHLVEGYDTSSSLAANFKARRACPHRRVSPLQADGKFQAAGLNITGLSIVGVHEEVSRRSNPELLINYAPGVSANTTTPWALDRIDQRTLPLDGKFTASTPGTGVSIYLLSSGVRYRPPLALSAYHHCGSVPPHAETPVLGSGEFCQGCNTPN